MRLLARCLPRACCGLLAALLAAPAAAQDLKPAADWTKKLTFSTADGRFTLAIGNRVQVLFADTDFESAAREDVSTFRIRRAKTSFEGNAFGDWLYKIQANWVGNPILEDAYFQYARYPVAQPWVGRGKAFFGRQELTSSGKLQFVDRSIVANRFFPGRDQGVALVGELPGRVLEYEVGLYNGAGIANNALNDNDEFMTVARAVWHPLGHVALEESSLDYPADPKVSIGAQVMQNETASVTAASGSTPRRTLTRDVERWGAELAFKWRGLNSVAEYVTEEAAVEDLLGTTLRRSEEELDAYYAQVGYLLPNRHLEIAGRHAVIEDDTRNSEITENRIALNWYLQKHEYKLQADFGTVEDTSRAPGEREQDEVRLQLQLAF